MTLREAVLDLVDPIFGEPMWWADEREEKERLDRETDLFMLQKVVRPRLERAKPTTIDVRRGVLDDPGIPRWVRQIVIARDAGTCVVCHGACGSLELGHFISRADGKKLGMTWADIHSPENIGLMGRRCNADLHSMSVHTPVLVRLMYAAQRLDRQLPLK